VATRTNQKSRYQKARQYPSDRSRGRQASILPTKGIRVTNGRAQALNRHCMAGSIRIVQQARHISLRGRSVTLTLATSVKGNRPATTQITHSVLRLNRAINPLRLGIPSQARTRQVKVNTRSERQSRIRRYQASTRNKGIVRHHRNNNKDRCKIPSPHQISTPKASNLNRHANGQCKKSLTLTINLAMRHNPGLSKGRSGPQTAEPATFPSSPNPQQGNCLNCGHQRFLNP
jgi:hypothetical protein